jgi:GNAT superfamily N-acetyltransferase
VFESHPLDDHHDCSGFSSGHSTLDGWLRDHAVTADAKRQGRTYVWHRPGDTAVVAYFTLSPHLLQRAELPRRLGRGDPDRIPSLLLARLALDQTLHGQGLGTELLLDALTRALGASNRVGGRYLVVDAIDDRAAAFYEHHGFHRVPGTALRRLVRKVSDIEASLI